MRALIKITALLGSASLINIIIGLARGKYLAWQLGPEGMGIAGQITAFVSFLISICTLNMSIGLIKYLSEFHAKNDSNKIKQLIHYSCFVQIPLSLVVGIVVAFFSKSLSDFIFSSATYGYYIVFIGFALPFVVFSSEIFKSIFYGFSKISDYSKALTLSLIVSFFLIVVFVFYLKIEGIFIHFFISSIASFIIYYYFLSKSLSFDFSFSARDIKVIKDRWFFSQLIGYGIAISINGMVGAFVLLHLRALLIKELGPEANGFYQIAFSISGYYMPFLTNSLWAYFYPRMSALKNSADYSLEINNYIRFCILGLTPIVVLLTTFKLIVIRLLFTSDFLPASHLIVLQGLGDFFFLIFYTLNTSLLARSQLKGFLIIATVGYNIMFYSIFFSALYIFNLNFKSLNIAYLFTVAFFAVINLAYHNYDIGLRLTSQNIKLILISLFLIMAIAFIPDFYILLPVKLILILLWCFMVLTKEEMKKIKELIVNKWSVLQPSSKRAI